MSSPILRLAAFAAGVIPVPLQQALYRLGPLTRAIRGLLNRAAPHGLHPVTVAGGDLAGMAMILDLNSEKDLWLGTYEPELQATLRDALHPGMIAYDVGANIGYVTLLMAKGVSPGGHVIAFEPLPANLERLRANILLNGLSDMVTILPLAAANRSAAARFHVHRSGGMGKIEGASGRLGHYERTIRVEAVRLDDLVFRRRQPPPDVIKVDIEGGEGLALRGMRRALRQCRPLLILELHGPEAASAAWGVLNENGYTVCWMRRGYPPIPGLGDLGWKSYVLGLPQGGSSEG